MMHCLGWCHIMTLNFQVPRGSHRGCWLERFGLGTRGRGRWTASIQWSQWCCSCGTWTWSCLEGEGGSPYLPCFMSCEFIWVIYHAMPCNCPPCPSNSHHQDYSISSNPNLNLHICHWHPGWGVASKSYWRFISEYISFSPKNPLHTFWKFGPGRKKKQGWNWNHHNLVFLNSARRSFFFDRGF